MSKARYLVAGLIAVAAPLAAAVDDLTQARDFYRTAQFENAYQAAMRAHRADMASLPALYITGISACRIIARKAEGRALLIAYRDSVGISDLQRASANAQLERCQIVVVAQPSGTTGTTGFGKVIAVGAPPPTPKVTLPKPGVTAQGHKVNHE